MKKKASKAIKGRKVKAAAAIKGTKKPRKAALKSGAKKRPSYNPQTGKLTGREVGAQERLEKRAEILMAGGMSPSDARTTARAEMRDNPRKDWRGG
jgi:hypothetical protein